MDPSTSDIPVDQSNDCSAKALDWALLILNILTTHVLWWAIHVPVLIREGFVQFYKDVSWECLRLHQPGYVGLVSCLTSPQEHWQARYFTGRTNELSVFKKYFKPFVTDTLLIASSILSIYRLCTGLRQNEDLSGLNSSLWSYPSLPVAITGLWIVIVSRTKLRKRWVFLGHLLVISLIGTAIALVVHFNDPYRTSLWYPALVIFVCMSIPIGIFDIRLAMLLIALAALARAGGPIFGATSNTAYFPFCKLRGMKFAAPLIVFTVIAALLALVALITKLPELNAAIREERVKRDMKRQQEQRQKDTKASRV
jgi:hypothetical protein